MFKNSLPARIVAGINALDDLEDIESVIEVVTAVSHSRAVMLTAMGDVTEAWDELEIVRVDGGVNITIKLHIEYKVWTNVIYHVMFSLMDEGFGWVDHLKAFELEFEYP